MTPSPTPGQQDEIVERVADLIASWGHHDRREALDDARAVLNYLAHLATLPGRWVPLEPTEADMERMAKAAFLERGFGRYEDTGGSTVFVKTQWEELDTAEKGQHCAAMRAAYRAMLEAAPAGEPG